MNARNGALVLVAALAACGYKPVTEADPSKQPAYAFPHSVHVDAGVACAACHDVASAKKLDPAVRHVGVPSGASRQKPCSDCHDKDPKAVPSRPARDHRLTFSHADHLKLVKDCRSCHQKLPEQGDLVAAAPPMAACTACHYHQREFAEARCTPCHTDLKAFKPETAFRHEGQWLNAHGQLAKPSAESCAQCHDQTYCTACHSPATAATRIEVQFPERVDRSFVHRGNYVGRHTVEAQASPSSCRRCHGSGFCDACHTANGFSASAVTGTLVRPLSHTAAFVAGGHKNDARRDISSCAACHDQQGAQQTCVGCHATGGTGGNPHPKKFLDKHDAGDRSRNAMCRTCHKS
ncbi:MAG TPA: cytochrome c3 family protein [Anaeromyxobacter sp.]